MLLQLAMLLKRCRNRCFASASQPALDKYFRHFTSTHQLFLITCNRGTFEKPWGTDSGCFIDLFGRSFLLKQILYFLELYLINWKLHRVDHNQIFVLLRLLLAQERSNKMWLLDGFYTADDNFLDLRLLMVGACGRLPQFIWCHTARILKCAAIFKGLP